MRPVRIFCLVVPFLTVLAADLISKAAAEEALKPSLSQPLIPGFIQLTLTRNTGIAFGIGQGHPEITTAIGCAIFVAICTWIYFKERSPRPLANVELVGAACILGGAAGNIIDRIADGEVTDFLEFLFVSFPVFNIADVMINIGVGLIILSNLLPQPNNSVDASRDTDT